MGTNLPLNPKPKTDLSSILGDNPLVGDGLVSLVYYEVAKLVIETRSKVQEPQTYDEAINDIVHGSK